MKPVHHQADAGKMRQRAEAAICANETRSAQPEAFSPEAMRIILHELRVHQIQLEMQNEELRRTQAELDASRARYFDLYDFAPVGYVTLSEQGLILEANLTAATLLGLARGALATQPIFSRFILKEDQDLYYRHRKQLIETGKTQARDLRMLKKDGTLFWAHIEASTAQDTEGAPVYRIILIDISERIQAEAEHERLETRNRQLQKAESLGRMAGAIAHHFNNHLQAVMGSLELAISDMPRDAGGIELLTDALRSAGKAAEVSSLMLTYLGQNTSQRETLDLAETCRQSLPILRAGMPQRVTLETEFPVPGPAIKANPNQIQQVLTNLVANAWESMGDAQGTLRLTVKTVAAAELPVANCFLVGCQMKNSAHACLEVADTGCGIAAKEIEKIFDPFFSNKFVGRGLGLSVVHGIVRAHSGAITVESSPAKGSVFTVYFPLSADTVSKTIPIIQAPATSRPSASVRDTQAGTVLIVEDEPTVRKIIAGALDHFGFTVLAAADGVDAVEIFRQHPDKIDCVLCDLTMPRMNGWETLTALRKLSPGIPVILASGYSEALAMAGNHPELPDRFLGKPYEIKALINAINEIVPPPHQAGTPPECIPEKAGEK